MKKRQLIIDFLRPRLKVTEIRLNEIVNAIYPFCLLIPALKHQILEIPGPANEGRVWLSAEAMAHSYSHCKTNDAYRGRRVYEKMEPMFSVACLIDGIDRDYYLQMLEPSLVLSITFKDALPLIAQFEELSSYVNYLSRQNSIALERRIILLHEPAPQQVKRFEEENKLFVHVASKEIKAMHLGLCRQAYHDQLKKTSTLSNS